MFRSHVKEKQLSDPPLATYYFVSAIYKEPPAIYKEEFLDGLITKDGLISIKSGSNESS